MIKLVLSDLWEHRHVWFGVVAVAVAFGFVGGWFASFTATAMADPTAKWAFFFKSAAQAMLLFSSVSAICVLQSTAQNSVVSLRRTYALWQLINMPPALVGCVAIGQITIAVCVGSFIGLLVQSLTAPVIFRLLFAGVGLFDGAYIQSGVSIYPVIVGVSMAISVLGGARAARTAMRTSPLVVLKDERVLEPETAHMSLAHWVVVFAACGSIAWCISTVDLALVSIDSGQSTWLVVLPVAIPALAAAIASVILPRILDACARLFTRDVAWSMACKGARHCLSQSTAIEVPLLVAAGIVGGWYAMMRLMERYYVTYGLPVGSGFDIDPRLACVMFGGPVLLAAIGSFANVVLSLRSRTRDIALLEVLGAGLHTVVLVAVLEAAVHVAAVDILAALSVLLSNAIAACVLGLALADAVASLEAAPIALILLSGFLLLAIAEVSPVCHVLKSIAIRVLALER